MTDGQVRGEAQVRREESIAAAAVLGCRPPEFWGLPDQGVLYGEALVARLLSVIDSLQVDVLYAPSLWENHPDHRAAALAAREAVRRQGRCILMAYEIGAALRPNCLIDITAVRGHKQSAMGCFGSQLALQRYDRHIDALNTFRTYTLSSSVEAAEAYERTSAQDLRAGTQGFLESEYLRQRDAGLMLLPEDADFVSVLIRSMDRPELDRALSSIAVQTWPRVEVVVVNAKGGEHRPLPPWCGRFPLRFVDSEQPLHRSTAANRALDAARGDRLLFLDDDDWLEPDHLAKLAQALAQRPDAAAAVTGVRGVDDAGHEVASWRGDAGIHRLMLANQMPIMSVLFRRDRLKEVRFDEQFDVFEDWDFWLQLAQTGTFVGVPGTSASYLIRPFQGSGVHQRAVSERALRQIRKKWRQRWPDDWYGLLSEELHTLEVRSAGQLEELERLRKLEPLTVSLAQAREAQRAAEEHAATMQHQRNIAEQQRVRAEALVFQAERQCVVADQQLARVQQQHDALVHELESVRHVAASANLQLQAMRNSRSWRLSAPLRALGRGLRKLR